MQKKVDKKANEDELQQTVEYMRKLPRNEDLQELYDKTVPQIGIYSRILNQFQKENAQYKKMILRFDEDLSLKANKMTVHELKQFLIKTYTVSTEIDKSEDQILERMEK